MIQSKQADEIYTFYEQQYKSRGESLAEIDKGILNTKSKFKESRINLRAEIINFFDTILLQMNSTDLETFENFYIKNIGHDGINIESEVNTLFDRYTESTKSSVIALNDKITAEFDFRDSLDKAFLKSQAKLGLNALTKLGINNKTVLASRDILRGGLGKMGIDSAMKFKPWGAAKFAKGFNGAMAGVGVGMEIWETWDLHQKNKKLSESKTELSISLNKYKAHLLSIASDEDNFIENFAPDFKNTLKSQEILKAEVAEFDDKAKKIKEWYKKADFITTVEFEEVA